MLKDTKIGFIGSGAMATAMIAGITKKNLVDADNIIAGDPYPAQLEKLSDRYHVNTTQNNLDVIKDRDIVVLSIKPQNLSEVGEELRGHIAADMLIVSIIAGATVQGISRKLHHYRVVRVMPNTPARVGKGMSVWTCTEEVSDAQKTYTKAILEALGEELFVDHENYLFMEAMIDAGVHMGFSRRVAEQLVYQTIEGSVAFARDSRRHTAELRNMVTSPGGTTADALYQLDKGGFRTVLSKAIWAAYKKSRYLGELDENG